MTKMSEASCSQGALQRADHRFGSEPVADSIAAGAPPACVEVSHNHLSVERSKSGQLL